MPASSAFVLRAVNRSGDVVFYTGRAGNGWVDSDRREAFSFTDLTHARGRAVWFNRYSEVHGCWFVAVPREGEP